jgi:hypothetical protein
MGLNHNWVKSYDTNQKHGKNAKNRLVFFTKSQKKRKWKYWVITFEPIKNKTCLAPQNDCLNLSFVKYIYAVFEKMARNGQKRPFISRKFDKSPFMYLNQVSGQHLCTPLHCIRMKILKTHKNLEFSVYSAVETANTAKNPISEMTLGFQIRVGKYLVLG